MNLTTLQIPLSKELKRTATEAIKEYGFSSLQEAVRIVLTKIAKREIGFGIVETFPSVKLSAKNEKRYAKMEEDFKKGRNVYAAKNVDDLMRQLRGN